MNAYIYGLVCPVKNQIMYVGKAVNAQKRLLNHIRDAINGGRDAKSLWIRGLLDNGYRPTLEILEVCSGDVWRERWQLSRRPFIIFNETGETNDAIQKNGRKLGGSHGRQHRRGSQSASAGGQSGAPADGQRAGNQQAVDS